MRSDLGRGRRSRRDNNKLISFYLGRIPTESEESTRRERTTYGYYNNNIVLARRPKDSRARLNYLYGYSATAAFRDLRVAATSACVKSGRPLTSKYIKLCLKNNTEIRKSNAPPRTDQNGTEMGDKKRRVDAV